MVLRERKWLIPYKLNLVHGFTQTHWSFSALWNLPADQLPSRVCHVYHQSMVQKTGSHVGHCVGEDGKTIPSLVGSGVLFILHILFKYTGDAKKKKSIPILSVVVFKCAYVFF